MVYLLVGQHILNSHHGGRGTGGWEFIILSAAVIEPRVSLERCIFEDFQLDVWRKSLLRFHHTCFLDLWADS